MSCAVDYSVLILAQLQQRDRENRRLYINQNNLQLLYPYFPPQYNQSMGKKSIQEIPKTKKLKTKHKQMFPQLATLQQQIVQRPVPTHKHYHKRVINADSQQEVELDILEHQNNDLDTICETVHKLLSKNKVSAKNAFDVPLIDLEQLPDFTGSFQNDYAWKKLSSTLENDYKIYGYRVDAIHTITYNILHTMSRRQQDIQALQNPNPQNPIQILPIESEKVSDGVEGQYLQKKIENLNLLQIDLALGVDPILQRNKRKFDQIGVNMLINSLNINSALTLELVRDTFSIKKYPAWGEWSEAQEWNGDDPLLAFTELAQFRARVEQSFEGKMREEQIYDLFNNQKENHFYENYANMDIQFEQYQKRKQIQKQIKWKNKKPFLQSLILQEAENWMDDKSNQLKKNIIKPQQLVKNEERYENAEDLVNFNFIEGAEDTRQSVFCKQNDKNQFKQEIEDKFLLAQRLPHIFQIEKYPLTLKEKPKQNQTFAERQTAQIDVRRQLISISDAKRKLRDLIHSRSTFKTLYSNYRQFDDMSPALCFLTMLHLANQNGLMLKQIDDTDFYIK